MGSIAQTKNIADQLSSMLKTVSSLTPTAFTFPPLLTDVKTGTMYKAKEMLGKGTFGICYSIKDDKNEMLACKMVPKELLLNDARRMRMACEMSIHSQLTHPHIVQLFSCFDDANAHFMIMERCANGTLYQLLKRKKRALLAHEATPWLYQLLDGIRYLHDQKIVHADLKMMNLFLDTNWQIKIGDFGLATDLKAGPSDGQIVGTPNYLAPETLMSGVLTPKVDMWAIGVILYRMVVGSMPFEERHRSKQEVMLALVNRITNGTYHPPILATRWHQSIIEQLLQVDPQNRPSAAQLLTDPRFTSVELSIHSATTEALEVVTLSTSNESANESFVIDDKMRQKQLTKATKPELPTQTIEVIRHCQMDATCKHHFNVDNLQDYVHHVLETHVGFALMKCRSCTTEQQFSTLPQLAQHCADSAADGKHGSIRPRAEAAPRTTEQTAHLVHVFSRLKYVGVTELILDACIPLDIDDILAQVYQ